jgi:hypothetical protein
VVIPLWVRVIEGFQGLAGLGRHFQGSRKSVSIQLLQF